jgi:hypothetical protein
MAKVYAADEIRLNLVNILSGSADPSSGAGVARNIGSFYARTAGSPGLYQKIGALATDWEKLAQSFAWFSVLDFGADFSGSVDATPAFTAAIAAADAVGGGVVFVPRGRFLVSQIALSGTGAVQIFGSGPNSVIEWTFDAAAAAGSLLTVTAGAGYTRVANLRFSGAGLSNPAASRANHLVLLDGSGGGVLDCRIEECWFGDMVAASGDGVHLVGSGGNLVERVWIRDNVFDGCSRFGVGVEQGWATGWVVENYFTDNETDIAIIGSANVNTNALNISHNEIAHTGAEPRAVRLEGDATGMLSHTLFANNLILNGFVTVANAESVNIYGNPIFSGAFVSAEPVLRVFGAFTDSVIVGNIVMRRRHALPGRQQHLGKRDHGVELPQGGRRDPVVMRRQCLPGDERRRVDDLRHRRAGRDGGGRRRPYRSGQPGIGGRRHLPRGRSDLGQRRQHRCRVDREQPG